MSCRVRSAAECEQTANMTAPTTQQTRPTAPATEKRVRNESQHRLHAPPQERRAAAAADDDELQLQQPAAADAIDEDCKWCTEPSVLLLTNFYDKQCKKLQIQISPNFYDGPRARHRWEIRVEEFRDRPWQFSFVSWEKKIDFRTS